ncbi:flagellar filament capping protein FliD [Eionea flava]
MSQNIVSALGAGSGIDTTALVSSLVDVERSATQTRIDTKIETAETQISDFGLVSSALSVLQDAAQNLNNPDTFNSKSASFTDSTAFIPVSLDPETQAGNYTFQISQLAQAQSLSSDALFTSPSDTVGEGTLTFEFGAWDAVVPPADPTTFTANTTTATTTITIDGTNNSLTGLAKAINDADFGVQASVVNDGDGYRLVTRAESGLDNQLRITAAESGGSPSNTDNTGLSRFAFNASAFQMDQNQVGQDAALTVNGLSVTRSTNTIDDVIDGFEFSLAGLTAGSESVSVTIDEDKSAGETAVREFFEAYNIFLEALEPITGFNEETETFGSLANDSLAKSIPAQIRQELVGTVTGLGSDFSSLTNIGIRTELDGSLSIVEDDFTAAISDNYDLFKNLFIPVTTSSTDQITINSTGENTTAGEYAVVITQPPTKGSLVGADIVDTLVADLASVTGATSATLTGAAPTAVLTDFVATSGNFVGVAATATEPLDLTGGSSNYEFSITVDGVASAAAISLAASNYTDHDALAVGLQTAINNDANISGVTVTYDTDHFVFTSSTTGADSSVAFSGLAANATELGLSAASGTNGTGGTTDYDFTLAVDGTTSGTISITPGTYATFDDLATHLTTQINADATLTTAGKTVAVTHDGSAFVVTSTTTGASSTIANATAVGSEASALGITTGTAVQGAESEYAFTVNVNGTTSGIINLTSDTFADKAAVATEIQNKINADSVLVAANTAVEVAYDSDNDSFVITSTLFGSTSNVSVTNIGASAADLGLSTGTSTAGINVAGTIDGVAGFGTGNVLLPALGEPGESLALIIGESATSATLNFSRGFGGQLDQLIEQFLDTNNGVISLRETSLNTKLDEYDDDQDSLDRRIEAYEERLTSQFIAMEAIVRSLQDSSSFLESTLESLLDSMNSN